MAGGHGDRLWPLSRSHRSKLFLPLHRGKTLLELTWERIARLVPPSRIVVVCGRPQADAIRRLLGLRADRLLIEPMRRDTAACIGLASLFIQRQDPHALCLVTPADHLVRQRRAFYQAAERAFAAATHGHLVVIGVTPSAPVTEYGYLKVRRHATGRDDRWALPVERFVEKPPVARARRWLRSREWLWNSGVFVWSVAAILQAIARHQPALGRGLRKLAQRSSSAAWKRCFDAPV